MNCLFVSKKPSLAAKDLEAFVQTKGLVFYTWKDPFDSLDLGILKDRRAGEFLQKGGNRVVVIKDLHLLAHASPDPLAFYRRLLSRCNYYCSQYKDLFFLLSDLAIPTPFLRENVAASTWEFHDCDDPTRSVLAAKTEPLVSTGIGHVLASGAYVDATTHAEMDSEKGLQDAFKQLRENIIGQEEAVQRFIDASRLAYGGFLRRHNGPRGVFLLVGPSGVGKTEICRRLRLPGYQFKQINLGEFPDGTAVNKLIGIGRGYEDSKLGGILTEPIKKNGRHVVLFDELDQADPSAIDLFYKIFEDQVTDGRGEVVSFRDCFLVLTTNKGVPRTVRSTDQALRSELRKVKRRSGVGPAFTDAFLGRIDSVMRFRELDAWDYVRIAERAIEERFVNSYRDDGIKVTFRATRRPHLLETGWLRETGLLAELFALKAMEHTEQGARHLIRLIEDTLVRPIGLSRLNYRGRHSGTDPAHIEIQFMPAFPKLDRMDYARVTMLVVDDQAGERERLRARLPAGVSVRQCGFDPKVIASELKGDEPPSVVLLDLIKANRDVLEDRERGRIVSACRDVPICIYSNLPAGPKLDSLRASCWAHGIIELISKRDDNEKVRERLAALVQRHQVLRKAAAVKPIAGLFLDAPVGDGHPLTFELKRSR